MQAASREALATLRAHKVVTDSAALSVDAVLAQVDELYAVSALLTKQPQLRRAIGDSAAAQSARTTLVDTHLRRQDLGAFARTGQGGRGGPLVRSVGSGRQHRDTRRRHDRSLWPSSRACWTRSRTSCSGSSASSTPKVSWPRCSMTRTPASSDASGCSMPSSPTRCTR